MRRLYLRIYLGFLATAGLVMAVTLATGTLMHGDEPVPPLVEGVARLIGSQLPPADAPPAELRAALGALSRQLELDAAVTGADGRRLASAGAPLPDPPAGDGASALDWRRRRGPPVVRVRLSDGRVLSLAPTRRGGRGAGGHGLLVLGSFALAVGVGAYFVSRGITRRVERLRSAVEELGEGELSARVPVEGRDEVAGLARSFNRAADRIEALVGAQRRLLASASHELRSPLTRLALAVELLGREGAAGRDLRGEAERDIRELDELIDDLLTAARLQSSARPERRETLDLAALVAAESGRLSARQRGDAPPLLGDPRLLRRLVRNLLENARRHGGGSDVEVVLSPRPAGDGPGARLEVRDRGPGVPEAERERIFEPFYRPAGHSEGRDGGVGLGLALVREIARHHGGDARCLPRDGGGSVFQVDLAGLP